MDVSPELQHKLELLRQAYSLPDATAVIELLIGAQINRSVYAMTGIKPGPKLAIDNARPARREGTT